MKRIAESTQLKTEDVDAVLHHAWAFAYTAVKKNKGVRIPCFEPLKLKHKPTRKEGTNVKDVKVAAKPAVVAVTPFRGLSRTRSESEPGTLIDLS